MIHKLALILALFGVWTITSTPSLRIRSVISAVAFYFIEATYLYVQGKGFHSTFAQFWCNVWSHPLISDLIFLTLLPNSSSLVRVGIFPLVIWALELTQSVVLRSVYGRNVAWDYTGNKYIAL